MRNCLYCLLIIPLLLLSACKSRRAQITIRGEIAGFDPDRDYTVRVLDIDHFENRLMAFGDEDNIKDGRLELTFAGSFAYKPVLELLEDDTVRCILVTKSEYDVENPVTRDHFRISVKEVPGGFSAVMDSLRFDIDRDPERVADYNLHFSIPTMEMGQDYRAMKGVLSPFPEGASYIVMVDGGDDVNEYEFSTPDFEITSRKKTGFLNIYMKSRYGWGKHIKQFDIAGLSLVFPIE